MVFGILPIERDLFVMKERLFPDKRITIFAGHYGSGKTNLAVNYALMLRNEGKKVIVLDLDIVNPYFRTKDSAAVFAEHSIRLISSPYANTNVEAPSIAKESYAAFDDPEAFVVIDVGGDDAGAIALGRFEDRAPMEDIQMILVVNKYRPLSSNLDDCREIVDSIENSSRIQFDGMVNNSNLSRSTTAEDVLQTVPFAQSLSEGLVLPLFATSVIEPLACQVGALVENVYPIRIYDSVMQSYI